mgnify:CR=1 FL=1
MPGWELIGKEERDAALSLFEPSPQSYFFTNKAKVRAFEEAFAKSLGVSDAVSVSSGTAALKVALKALGVGPGDEVITQAHTFVATVEAIVDCGATPVITEIDESLNMDPDDLRNKLTRRTKVILPVHMLGVACQMDEILSFARSANVKVVEDTAQACHGTYRGWRLGTMGDLGTFSFSYSKILTTGEGGMVIARDPLKLVKARSYSDHGHDNSPSAQSRGQDTHACGGFNYRMGAFQAAVGLVQLAKLTRSILVHRHHKAMLKEALGKLAYRDLPDPDGDLGDAVCFFMETEQQAQKVARRLFEHDKIMLKNLPDALNWHSAEHWHHLIGMQAMNLKWSGKLLRRTIALQVCYKWTDADIQRVAQAVQAAIKEA